MSSINFVLLVALVTRNPASRLKNEAVELAPPRREISELQRFLVRLPRASPAAIRPLSKTTFPTRCAVVPTHCNGRHDHVRNDDAAVPEEIRREAAKLIADPAAAANTSDGVDCRRMDNHKTWSYQSLLQPGHGAIAVELGMPRSSAPAVAEPEVELPKKQRRPSSTSR